MNTKLNTLVGTYLDIVHEETPMHPSYVWRRVPFHFLTVDIKQGGLRTRMPPVSHTKLNTIATRNASDTPAAVETIGCFLKSAIMGPSRGFVSAYFAQKPALYLHGSQGRLCTTYTRYKKSGLCPLFLSH